MRFTTETLQTTGYYPFKISSQKRYEAQDVIDRRTITLIVHIDEEGCQWYKLTLGSAWDGERENAIVSGPFVNDDEGYSNLANSVHADAALILPPGAGYPGTPEYVGRQAKLKEQLHWLTVSCLSAILLTIYQESDQIP